jgi:hypothetical protein
MPDTTGGKKHEIGVKMIFGKTELEFRALNKKYYTYGASQPYN